MVNSPTIIGVDIGGTKSSIARYSASTFEIEAQETILTNAARGFTAVIDDVCALVKRMKATNTIAVGVGVPGLVRQLDGVLLETPNIPGGNDLPLLSILKKALDLPIAITNDSQCFALAEAISGAGKGEHIVVGITMGTGVGGGVVIDGKIVHGTNGFAGELGHMLLMPGSPPYKSKNQRGNVEQFLSGTALGKRCTAAKKPEEYLEGEACAFLRPNIVRETAWICTNVIYFIDPSMIVFGGSAGRALSNYLDDIKVELRRWLLPTTPLPKIAIAKLTDAATKGAAIMAKNLVSGS